MTFKQDFQPFVCEGDRISCEHEGYTFTARLERDDDSHVDDAECYTKSQIAAWKADEWSFFGIVISVERNGVLLSDHAASLWGIEGNFPSRRKNPNRYFREAANNLLDEALAEAKRRHQEVLSALAVEG
jgi:hypothetical protein